MGEYLSIPIITAQEVEAAFPLSVAIENQREVFSAFDRGLAVMGERGVIPNGTDASFAYIARADNNAPTIIKFGSVTNSNAERNLPVVQAYIAVLDPVTGSLIKFVDGESVTRIRTTAASMLAAQLLSNSTNDISIIGAGLQGIAHAKAALELFNPKVVRLVVRKPNEETDKFQKSFPNILISTNIDEALDNSDLIFTCTNSITPVINRLPKKGATLISIGSFSPNREEVSGEVVSKADLVFGDDSKTIQKQSGSILAALKFRPDLSSPITSLGTLINNPILGRKSSDEVIMYFSVGLGVQDAGVVAIIMK